MYSFNFNDIHVSNICFNDACIRYPPYYLLEVNCVKFILIYKYIFFLHKTEGCHGAGFAVAVGIAGCHNDNLRCRQWRHSWHCGSSRFLVFMTCLNAFMYQTNWFVRYRYTMYHRSLHISGPVFSKQPRTDNPCFTCKGGIWEVFKWLIVGSELWLCSACFCSILRWQTDITRAYSINISEKIFSYICHMMLYFYHKIYMM